MGVGLSGGGVVGRRERHRTGWGAWLVGVPLLAVALVVASFQPPAVAESGSGSGGAGSGSAGTASAGDFGSGSDLAVDGGGSSDGYHVRVARSGSGFGWRDVAVIRPAGLDEASWYGFQCVSDDGKFIAVAVLPGDAVNDNVARDRGAYAYAVEVSSGKVTALASGVAYMYHTPGCGTGDDAVFTAALGVSEQTTQVLEYDLSSGGLVRQSVVSGEVSSVVPLSGGDPVGALGQSVVSVPSGGSVSRPVAPRRVVSTDGSAYGVRANAEGGTDFLTVEQADKTAGVWHEAGGSARKVGSGPIGSVGLFAGAGGRNRVVGAGSSDGSIGSVDDSALPLGAQIVSLSGSAEFGKPVSSGGKGGSPQTAAQAQALSADAALVESTASHRVFTAANAQVTARSPSTASGAGSSSAGSSSAVGAVPGGQGSRPVESKPSSPASGAGAGDARLPVSTRTGPLTPAASASGSKTAAAKVSSSGGSTVRLLDASTPTCAVPRLTPTLQAMQPSDTQVDWATDMAEQGNLVGQFARPANFQNTGLASYEPSSDFPPIAVENPTSDGWNSVPRVVMEAIEAQESNFNQASWHALPGLAGDPLIADYYGAGDSISTIDYAGADCGYGIAQVTNGMTTDLTWLSAHGQMKVATDYEENIAAGLEILENTWNQLTDAGITANNGDPKYLENWYLAAWAYNSGVEPTAAFGNTSGCTPSGSCTGPDGTWGLGWANNPANPAYSPARTPYLENTYADAAHPGDWPYQERIMGWMGSSLIRYGYLAYDTADYQGGQGWLQIPGVDTFCSAGNDCSGGVCSLGDSECWWHGSATWVADCDSSCATSSYETNASTPAPAYTARYSPTCSANRSMLPSSTVIVSVLSTIADNDEGCSGQNWSDGGSFTYSPGTDSSGNPVGDVDTHQLGSGFDGYILFTHTEPSSAASVIDTGTWTPNLPSLQYYTVMVHLPASGAAATDVVYTINPGGGAAPWKIRVNQDWESEEWVPIATVAMQNGGSVSLSNASSMPAGVYDVAFDSVAFVPRGGTPGVPIGGPPTVQDEPAGSNPAMVQCGCATSLAGDPVDTASGAFSQSASDLSVPGVGAPLSLARTYASSLANPSGSYVVNGAFGPGWTYSYGLSAATNTTSGNVTLTQEDGSQVVFTDTAGSYTAPTVSPFADVATTDQFYTQIAWLAGQGISTGYPQPDGTSLFEPLGTVTRDAMAAFLYRMAGSPQYTAPVTSPFTDVGTDNMYYKQICWLASSGISTGWVQPDGTRQYEPLAQVARNAMAAFLYRFAGSPSFTAPVTSPFADVAPSDQFYKEMTWLASSGISTGWVQPDGTSQYEPLAQVARNAMAAFLYRYAGDNDYTPPVRDDVTLAKYGPDYFYTRHGAVQYEFDAASGRLIGESDEAGRVASPAYQTSLAYNAAGQLSTVTDPAGRALTFTWSGAHITKAVDAAGRQVDYGYSPAGDLTDVWGVGTTRTDGADGNQDHTVYAYTSAHLMSAMTSPADEAKSGAPHTAMVYDASGRVISQTDPAGAATTFAYGPSTSPSLSAGQTLVTDGAGHETLDTYTNGLLTSKTDGYGAAGASTWSYVYDPVSLGVAQQTNPDGTTQTFSYDQAGHQISASDQTGLATSYQYTRDGQVAQKTDPTGVQTFTSYNTAGAPTQVLVSSDGQSAESADDILNPSYQRQTSSVYADAALPGLATSVTDPNGNATGYAYDTHGQLIQATDAAGDGTLYGYDLARGLRTSTVSAKGVAAGVGVGCTPPATGCTTVGYDVYGNLTTTTDPDGHVTSAGFDADGNETSTTDGNGRTTTTGFDNDDRATSVTQASGAVSSTVYNGDGTVQRTVDANGKATGYTYNAQGQKLTSTDPDGHTTTLTRDVMGRVRTSTAPGGQVTTDSYDPDGRLAGVSYSDGTHGSGFGYDPDGRLVSMSDATGTSGYGYDVFGELTSQTDGAGATTGYTYDGDGNTTSIAYPGTAGTVTRGFNKVDQLTSITDPAGNSTGFGYDRDGDLTTTSAGNGTTVTVGYDGADQAMSSTLTKGASALGAIADTRDADGDLTATAPSAGAPGTATGYTYTADQRLASSVASGTTTSDGYDPAGDPTTLGTSTQVFDPAGRLCWSTTATVTSPACGSPATGATTYSSNVDGQRTATTPASGTATGYAYNGAGQLTGVNGTASASYTYDGAGLRASKTVAGATTVFTWDTAGSTPLLLSDGATDYVYGPAGVVVEQFNASGVGGLQYYFADAHGSTVALTNSTGVVDGTWAYSPWGAITAHTGAASTPILYAGAYADAETGLLYLQARYYDPTTALFLTADPLVALTGQGYLYTGDDPLNRTDPTGLWTWGQVGRVAAIAGAVVGIAAISVATFGGADAFIGASAVTWGLALDTTATVLGAISTGVDCASDFASVECALDSASMIFGIGGVFGDIDDIGRGFSLEMGSLSETAAVGSLASSFGDDDDREDDEGSGSSEGSSSTGGYGSSSSSGTGSYAGGNSGYGNYSGSRWRGGSPC